MGLGQTINDMIKTHSVPCNKYKLWYNFLVCREYDSYRNHVLRMTGGRRRRK
jgi:hypothetical protein